MKTKLQKTYNIAIRLIVIILAFYFLYDQLFHRKDLTSLPETLSLFSDRKGFWLLLTIVIMLIPANIVLETFKWKFLISKLENVSFINAFKAVLTGITVSMFMPNRTGDYFGRVFILKKADRFQAILSTMLGSMAQLITTILFGFVSVAFLYPQFVNLVDFSIWLYVGLLILLVIAAFTIVFAYLEFAAFTDILKRITGREYRRIEKYAQVFSWYHSRELLKVLLFSIFKYLVFSFQFFLLLKAFGVTINYFESMLLIAMVYLLMSIIPTIALSEIGIRGSVSIYVFETWMQMTGAWSDSSAIGVVTASSLLWLVNLAFPALIGLAFVFSLKFFRKEPVT
ncbi:MAG: hypothetical protein DRJ09_05345 [Bacteroidetes bacterium]|nr:MAG: hypothetical protein DRJ09_05345 [Bacteroidota bacterium]